MYWNDFYVDFATNELRFEQYYIPSSFQVYYVKHCSISISHCLVRWRFELRNAHFQTLLHTLFSSSYKAINWLSFDYMALKYIKTN